MAPPPHQAFAVGRLSPLHTELLVRPRILLEEHVHVLVVRSLLHRRDPLPRASENGRNPHEPAARTKYDLHSALPFLQAGEGLRDGYTLLACLLPRVCLPVHKRQRHLINVETPRQLELSVFFESGLSRRSRCRHFQRTVLRQDGPPAMHRLFQQLVKLPVEALDSWQALLDRLVLGVAPAPFGQQVSFGPFSHPPEG